MVINGKCDTPKVQNIGRMSPSEMTVSDVYKESQTLNSILDRHRIVYVAFIHRTTTEPFTYYYVAFIINSKIMLNFTQ